MQVMLEMFFSFILKCVVNSICKKHVNNMFLDCSIMGILFFMSKIDSG